MLVISGFKLPNTITGCPEYNQQSTSVGSSSFIVKLTSLGVVISMHEIKSSVNYRHMVKKVLIDENNYILSFGSIYDPNYGADGENGHWSLL